MQILYYCLAFAKQIVLTREHEELQEHLWVREEHRELEEQRSGGYCLAFVIRVH